MVIKVFVWCLALISLGLRTNKLYDLFGFVTSNYIFCHLSCSLTDHLLEQTLHQPKLQKSFLIFILFNLFQWSWMLRCYCSDHNGAFSTMLMRCGSIASRQFLTTKHTTTEYHGPPQYIYIMIAIEAANDFASEITSWKYNKNYRCHKSETILVTISTDKKKAIGCRKYSKSCSKEQTPW